jgi:hypothetical protein
MDHVLIAALDDRLGLFCCWTDRHRFINPLGPNRFMARAQKHP